jgi:hypothetical protein
VVAEGKLFPSVRELFQMLATFAFVTFAWVFFRAETFLQGYLYLERAVINIISNPSQLISIPIEKALLIPIIVFLAIDWLQRQDERRFIMPNNIYSRYAIYSLMALFVFHFIGERQSFIYFQF